MTIELLNMDNMKLDNHELFNLIYCDFIYENLDFSWADKYYKMLYENSVIISQTDWHSDYRLRVHMEDNIGAFLVNDLKYKCEWGNHPKDRFHQCFDSILVYSNCKKGWTFKPEVIQVKKATAGTNLNPSGRMTKTATAWIDDIVLTTTAKERVKKSDGHLVRWQKPLRLYDRIIAPFINKGDWVLDPFMGSGSLGKWCYQNDINYVGIEKDKEVFKLAKKNIYSK